MIEFKEVTLQDKIWADELLGYSDFRGCEYSFGNNYIWREIYDIKIARYKDFYLLRNNNGYFFPAGRGNLEDALNILREDAERNGKPLIITSMDKSSRDWLGEKYGEGVEISTNRDLFDYIYAYDDLSTLAGKKLHSKRNHINRFKESNWNYETINRDNINECFEMSKVWCDINGCEEDDEKRSEACAVNQALLNYFELGFMGGLLRVDGRVHAFTIGEKLNSDTIVVHIEKAFTEIQGTYPAINYEFINNECSEVKYINREEDMGVENLRKAKLSYKPVFMEEKFKALFK